MRDVTTPVIDCSVSRHPAAPSLLDILSNRLLLERAALLILLSLFWGLILFAALSSLQ